MWLIKEMKPSSFLAEVQKGVKRAVYMLAKAPHVIPHKDRVLLFRKFVAAEKESLGIRSGHDDAGNRPSTLITVHRGRIVEDGYRQLALLQPNPMKGLIRVKFVNEQIAVLQSHHNGRDTHIRQVRLYAPGTQPVHMLATPKANHLETSYDINASDYSTDPMQ